MVYINCSCVSSIEQQILCIAIFFHFHHTLPHFITKISEISSEIIKKIALEMKQEFKQSVTLINIYTKLTFYNECSG